MSDDGSWSRQVCWALVHPERMKACNELSFSGRLYLDLNNKGAQTWATRFQQHLRSMCNDIPKHTISQLTQALRAADLLDKAVRLLHSVVDGDPDDSDVHPYA